MGERAFKGDSDLIGTWDVTLTIDEEVVPCTAEIDSVLKFVITCSEDVGEYDEGCDSTLEQLRVTGSISAPAGGIQLDEIERYSGPSCASYGFSSGKDYIEREGDLDIMRLVKGIGTLGGKWAAKAFEWDCLGDDESCKERGRSSEYFDCSFELNDRGKVTLACEERDTSGETQGCYHTAAATGAVGDGVIAASVTLVDKGTDCEEPEADVATIHAVRK